MKQLSKVVSAIILVFFVSSLQADRSAGGYVDDSVLHSKVKAALVGDDFFGGMDINIEVNKGVVQLAGFVDSKEQRNKAGEAAASVEGVAKVSNQLYRKSAKRTSGQAVDDTVIGSKVKSAIVSDFSVNIDVYDGVVLLSGFASDRDEIDAAVKAAEGVKNVTKVINGIDIAK